MIKEKTFKTKEDLQTILNEEILQFEVLFYLEETPYSLLKEYEINKKIGLALTLSNNDHIRFVVTYKERS